MLRKDISNNVKGIWEEGEAAQVAARMDQKRLDWVRNDVKR